MMETGLTSLQKNILLGIARRSISCQLNPDEVFPEIPEDEVFREKTATFVTLKISGKLRGCIGHLKPVTSLWKSVRDNAKNAAFHDHRFPPLRPGELEKTKIDISILSSSSLLDYVDSDDLLKKLQPGVDGVVLRDGQRRATFLPQVWEQLPSAEQFLAQLCQKAGLQETAWLAGTLEIKVYRVLSFGEGDG